MKPSGSSGLESASFQPVVELISRVGWEVNAGVNSCESQSTPLRNVSRTQLVIAFNDFVLARLICKHWDTGVRLEFLLSAIALSAKFSIVSIPSNSRSLVCEGIYLNPHMKNKATPMMFQVQKHGVKVNLNGVHNLG
jgi:hypothetical protein